MYSTIPGDDMDDGKKRCKWAERDELSLRYHDEEWGVPLNTDSEHLERLALEIFQAGLSWWLMLAKRDGFVKAFDGFVPEVVALYGDVDIEMERLLSDRGIVRNRRKIEAVIHNAGVFVDIARIHGSYTNWFNGLPTDENYLLAEFRKLFKFCGPEVTRSYLMSVGKILAEHEDGCWRKSQAQG